MIAGSGVIAGMAGGVTLPVLEDPRLHARGGGPASLTSSI